MTTAAQRATAVVLIGHGSVESLDDLPEFLSNIRRGHAAPAELVAEVRRRYEAIGGRSPLNDIARAAAEKLERRIGLPTRVAARLFHPYPREVIAKLAAEGIERIVTVPLAQHSAPVYEAAMRAAAREVAPAIELLSAPNWGRTPELTRAYASAVLEACGRVPAGEAQGTALVLTAHSLPRAVIEAGDPYELEVRASAEDVVAKARELGAEFGEHVVAFQSQGIGQSGWLGPDLRGALHELSLRGFKHIVLSPIGFLADHVEILYDLDIEAKGWSRELGIVLYRSASLNAGEGMIEALAAVTRDVLASNGGPDHPTQAERAQAERGG